METWYGLGYPRSANSWVRFIVRTCLNKPEINVHSVDDVVERDVYVKRHNLDLCSAGRNLLLLVRNYKEVIIRHNLEITEDKDYNFYNSMEKMPDDWTQPAVSYIHPIYVYDNYREIMSNFCNAENLRKHLVYYEDLVDNPIPTIQNMAKEMGFCADDFLQNYEYHRDRSVNAYNTQDEGGSWTKAGDVFPYREKITEDQKRAWDQHLKTNFPILFDRYLKRYEE